MGAAVAVNIVTFQDCCSQSGLQHLHLTDKVLDMIINLYIVKEAAFMMMVCECQSRSSFWLSSQASGCLLQGKRYSLPNSRIMIHQPLGGAQGQAADIEIQANEILHHKLTLNGYLAEFTGQGMERITQDTGQ